ncbi:hypothetical protein BDR04DRAFT_1153737 [Suillus decipiens]|nr:hypothetical protein BDR04DRAFT_1153737 [Suillus decipiens]
MIFNKFGSIALTYQHFLEPESTVPIHSDIQACMLDIINQYLTSPHDTNDICTRLQTLKLKIQEQEDLDNAPFFTS